MQGLTEKEVRARLQKFGANELQTYRGVSFGELLLSQFRSPLVYVLLVAGLVTLYLKDWTDAVVIFLAVIITGLFGYLQESKAQKALIALRQLLIPQAEVMRGDQQKFIPARELVPDDLVILTLGDQVPADGVLLEATDLLVNEAILTGESLPVKKKTGEPVFMGTIIAHGIARMRVAVTGIKTKMGQIGLSVSQVDDQKTPLQNQISRLVWQISAVSLIVGLLIFILSHNFPLAVAITVAAIPEGLVVSLTIILALGMERLFKRRALVRRFTAAETLGSVSTLCIDKTGTLTEGKMTVVDYLTDNKELLIRTALLCNDLRDPLEIAMAAWAEKNVKSKTLSANRQRLDEIPFSPQTKLIATFHQGGLLLVSGAPEEVLKKCSIANCELRILEDKFKEYAEKGHRLVGFAYKNLHNSVFKIHNSDLADLAWLGVLVFEDPIRPGVAAMIQQCYRAGLKIKVITGDYPETAKAILRQLRIANCELRIKFKKTKFNQIAQDGIVTGEGLKALNSEELKEIIDQIVLFARTTPDQKLAIVRALQANGEVVGMMGDGVNDAPALAAADIGIVVNNAADVAKQTAELVLLNSRFGTVVAAIQGGRTIFDNIRKTVVYLLADSLVEVTFVVGALLLGLPTPLAAAQIIWLNLVEDILPGVALAFEKNEPGEMTQPPRAKKAPILSSNYRWLILGIVLLTDLLLWLVLRFRPNQTFIFAALGLHSLLAVYSLRVLRRPVWQTSFLANRAVNLAVVLGIGLLLLTIYFPPLQLLLRTQPLHLLDWLWLFLLIQVNLVSIEGVKKLIQIKT